MLLPVLLIINILPASMLLLYRRCNWIYFTKIITMRLIL